MQRIDHVYAFVALLAADYTILMLFHSYDNYESSVDVVNNDDHGKITKFNRVKYKIIIVNN